ncbi:hypothetical protein Tco_1564324, partial [Tanacetum coccineum]
MDSMALIPSRICEENTKDDHVLKFYRSYKAVRLRFSDPMIQPEPEGSTQGYPLVSVEVLRVNLFTMKMEILLESTSNKLMVGRSSRIRSADVKMVVDGPDFSWAHMIHKPLMLILDPTNIKVIMKGLVHVSKTFRYSDTTHLSRSVKNPNGNGNVVAARAEGNAIGNNGNQIRCYNGSGLGHLARNCTVRPKRRDAAYLQTQLLIAQKEEAGIQLQDEEFDLMAAASDLDEIEEVNANCILMANLQQALTSGTQTDKASVYDSDGSAEVHNYDNCYDNEIFNMFTQDEQYTELLEPIPEPHQ